MNKPSGFTLVLDGKPEEVARIIGAIGDEFAKVERDAWRALEQDLPLGLGRSLCPRLHCSLRGRVELRHDLAEGFPE